MKITDEMIQKAQLDKIDKAKETDKIKDSKFFKKYFKPYLEKQIVRYKNINEVDTSSGDVTMSFWKNKIKAENYQSILNLFDQWTKIKVKDEGGDKDGGRNRK